MKLAQISLTLSCHTLLSSIAFGRSSRQNPVSVQSCCKYILAGRHTFACRCDGVHWVASLMISPLVFQQCPACLAPLFRMVFEMESWSLYSCCFAECCHKDLFNRECSILIQLPSNFFSVRLISVHIVHLYSSIDITAAWKKCTLFYLIGLISMWPIAYRWLSMQLIVVCWSHFRLMRCCFRGWWTCLQVSEIFHLVWRCLPFD